MIELFWDEFQKDWMINKKKLGRNEQFLGKSQADWSKIEKAEDDQVIFLENPKMIEWPTRKS